jgi:predicted enzyme related to lactoylglutathione lyase
MLKNNRVFNSFSVNDLSEAKAFYAETLGLDVEEMSVGLNITLAGGGEVFVYPKPDHTAASFTILNFIVDNIDSAVEELTSKGVTFEQYDGHMKTDEKGIFRGAATGHGPNIAWFKDPAGNIIAVMEEM